MKKIKLIEDIVDGDVLGEPIINSFGLLLLPGGAPLNERHIRMFKMWNIKQVTVTMDVDNYASWLNDDLLEYAYKIFSGKCLWKPDNDFDLDLFNMGVVYEARKIFNDMQKKR